MTLKKPVVPKVEAWAAVWDDGISAVYARRSQAESWGQRTVHLIPENPAQERELKGLRRDTKQALEFLVRAKNPHANREAAIALLTRAISRTAKGRAK